MVLMNGKALYDIRLIQTGVENRVISIFKDVPLLNSDGWPLRQSFSPSQAEEMGVRWSYGEQTPYSHGQWLKRSDTPT